MNYDEKYKASVDLIEISEEDELEAVAEMIIEAEFEAKAAKGKDFDELYEEFLKQGLSDEEAFQMADQEFKYGPCQCGSGQNKEEQYDYHGIYAGRMCDKCFKEKFRQDDYTLDTDEVVDEDY